MRLALAFVAFAFTACRSAPTDPAPEVGLPVIGDEVPVAEMSAATGSWLLWPTSGDQVEVLGTWVDGVWVGGMDAPPVPGATQELVSLSGESSGSLTGAARTVCDQLLLQYQGPFVGDEVVLLSPARPSRRPVTDVEAQASDRSLAGQLWGDPTELEPDRVVVADLDGDGTKERVVVFSALDDEGTPLHSAVAVVSADAAPVFSGWPGPAAREDLTNAGVPTTAHRVELKGVADVNADGSLELVAIHHIDGAHYHGLVIYNFVDGQLAPIGNFAWGERDCYPPSAWSET